MIRSALLNVLLVCVPLTFMVASLGLSTYSVVKVGINSCGSVQNFAYSESIHPELKQTLFQDVIMPNGCNQCSDQNHVPIWLAPGDMCDMQQTYGRLTYHPKFQHCSNASYATDFNLTDHVKACVTKEAVTYLWESGHCHDTFNTTSLPFFDSMKEGLLFCAVPLGIVSIKQTTLIGREYCIALYNSLRNEKQLTDSVARAFLIGTGCLHLKEPPPPDI